MSKTLIETFNLKKSFEHMKNSITLFDNLNIKIKEGELVALVGPSGSGKSSLLHLLALLEDPSKGKISINKQDTKLLSNNQKDELRRKNISIIFQDNNLLNDFTAIENVMMPLIIRGENKKKIIKKAQKILKDVKIINRSNHFPNELSGGEQQRVAIARAIVHNPVLILADEPTGELDSVNSRAIFGLFKQMVEENNMAVVAATHDSNLLEMSDRVLRLSEGYIEEDATYGQRFRD